MNKKKRIDLLTPHTVFYVMGMLLLYFIFAEIVLRVSGTKNVLNELEYYASMVFTRKEWREAENFRNDLLNIGIRGRMIKGTIIYNYRPAGSETVNFNSLGFRGKEIGKKGDDEYRIAIVGASRIWGSFLPDNKTIPVMVEKKLREQIPEKNITVVNLGVEGSDLQRGIATAKYFMDKIEPDLIVFYGGFTDMSYAYIFGNVEWLPFTSDSDMDEETFQNLIRSIYPDKWWQRSRVINLAITSAKAELGLTIAKNIQFDDIFSIAIPEQQSKTAKEFPSVFFNRVNNAHEYFQNKGVEQIFILPSTVQLKQRISELEEKIISNYELIFPGYNAFIKKCYEGVLDYFSSTDISFTFIDHNYIFDEEVETIYFDGMHVSPRGSKIIGESISEIIFDFLTKND